VGVSLPPSPPSSPPPHESVPYPVHPAYPVQRGYTGPPPSKTRAGWALGLALVPSVISWVVALGLAISVLSDARDGRDHGQRMAKAALAIVAAWVVLAVVIVAVVVSTGAKRDKGGRVTDGGHASVLDLRVGDCLATPLDRAKHVSVPLVPCTEPHRVEVYAVFELDGSYSTQDEIGDTGQAGCLDRFEAFAGAGLDGSTLGVSYLVPPDRTTFDKDPGVTCMVEAADPVTGTLRGSQGSGA
jgi:hypothetical protein